MRISDWSSDVCSSDLPGLCPMVVKRKNIESSSNGMSLRLSERLALNPALSPISACPRQFGGMRRSDERRVGKECVSTYRNRWAPNNENNNKGYIRLQRSNIRCTLVALLSTLSR